MENPTRTKIKTLLTATQPSDTILLSGWVRTRRDAKSFSFMEVNDGSCLKNIQVIADENLTNYEDIKKLTTGSAVTVQGALVASNGERSVMGSPGRGGDGYRFGTGGLIRCRKSATAMNFCAPSPICGPAPTNTAPPFGSARKWPLLFTNSFGTAVFVIFIHRSLPVRTVKGPASCFR